MPPPIIADPKGFDVTSLQFGPEEIRKRNPHRFELELLHGIVRFDPAEQLIVGVHQAREDDFWVRGHIPGRPLMPGVLLIEAAAQLCSFYWIESVDDDRFFGFGGIDKTRFRGTVRPGDTLIIVAKPIEIRAGRRAIFNAQGFVGDQMVFETQITGMPV